MLGAGGMGVVIAATHVDLDRPVAVKLIRQELAEDGAAVERLMLEARSAAKIKSDHVGKVLDVGKLDNGVPYIVMEYLEGVDVCQLLEDHGQLSIMEAVDFVLQACEALSEAHLANIVHRDLKPENLFVTRLPDGSPHIKVLDFGISKQLGDSSRRQLTNPSSAVGSPQYMAPEQMQAGNVDMRADIWALGAILYELISNRPAFEGATLPEICVKVMGSSPIPLTQHVPNVPDKLEAIVNRCLSKDRDQRFASIGDLVEELAPFGSERSIQSRNRIIGLLSGGGAATTEHVPVRGFGSGATQVATTPGSGLTVPVAKTEQWTPAATGETTPARNVSRWPVFAGLGGVVAIGVGLWFFTKAAESSESQMVAGVETASSPEPPPEASAAEVTTPEPTAAVVVTPTKVETPDAGVPAVAPVLERPQVAPKPATKQVVKPKPRKKAVSPRPAPTKKPGNAWDTDNFGGRR